MFPNENGCPDLPSDSIVRNYLDTCFPGRTNGVASTPFDYYLWSFLKSKVYIIRPQNLEDLRNQIREEIRLISANVILNIL